MKSERHTSAWPVPTAEVALVDQAQARDEAFGAQLRHFVSGVGPVISPASFWVPEYFSPSGWIAHAPFAFWICDALRPRRFVELGTHYGYSYFAFCQAIDRLGLGTTAYAVDTWQGDEHAGFYNEEVFRAVDSRNKQRYTAFSCLMRTTFEGALDYFADDSVDLLHIDGRHFYDDVKHDFTIWRPKLTKNAIVLFHDINVREREFGVWKFFEEIGAQHPSFHFFHGHGLGVLALGDLIADPVAHLFRTSVETADQIRAAYASLGGALTARRALGAKSEAISFLLNDDPRATESDPEVVARISDSDEQALRLLAAFHARDSRLDEQRAQLERHVATATALQVEVDQRAVTEAALREEVERRAATEAALREEIQRRATTEAALREEVERRTATEVTLQEEIAIGSDTEAALRIALDEAGRQMERWGDKIAAEEAEIAALSRELTKLNQILQERAATEAELRSALNQGERQAEHWRVTVEAGKAEVASMNGELAKLNRQLQEREAAGAALQEKNEILRDSLTQGERRLQEGETANSVLRSEAQSLRDQLAIAREVGGAAIAALRTEIGAVAEPPPDSGWLAQIRRVFRIRARLPFSEHLPTPIHAGM